MNLRRKMRRNKPGRCEAMKAQGAPQTSFNPE